MTIKDRLEQRADRVPPRDPGEVLAAARARAGTDARPVRERNRGRILAVAAGVLGVVALSAGAFAVLSDDGDDTVTVAGPGETAKMSVDGDWALVAIVRDGSREAVRPGAQIRIEGSAVTGTDLCRNELVATLSETGIDLGEGSDAFMGCAGEVGLTSRAEVEALPDDQAASIDFWDTMLAEPQVELRGAELWVVAGNDALVFREAGVVDDQAAAFPPRSGQDCPGLRSETRWADAAGTDETTAPAGGSTTYVETITNGGGDACSVVWEPCPAPGLLFDNGGAPLPGATVACPAIGVAAEDLAPGESRDETWILPVNVPPGNYELRVPQRDGTVASLPLDVVASVGACEPGASDLMADPPFDQYVEPGDSTVVQLQFAETAQECTIGITEVVMTLGTGARLIAHQFTSDTLRWYTTGPNRPAFGEVTLGPIELPAAQYEGTIEVRLENGESFTKPARLLVGDDPESDSGDVSHPVTVMSFEFVEDDRLRLTLAYCGDAYGVHAEETAKAVTVRAETSDDPQTVAPDCATFAEIGLARPLGNRTLIDGTTGKTVPQR